VTELLLTLSDHDLPGADHGNIFDDLAALLSDITELLRKPLTQALLRASLDGNIDSQTRRGFWAERMQRSSVIIDRAIQRGELPSDSNPQAILEHAASTIYFRILVTGEPVSEHDIKQFAHRAIRAAQHD
jgi:hypothetical protein